MDFDSPDVEKDFPGLYASEGADGKSKKSKEDSDYSDGEHDKQSKKELLIGRRKDKKDKSKDKGYAALEGDSSGEELDAKSPSKSKKSKTFKFTSSKSKEKREKSREKDKLDDDKVKEKFEKDKYQTLDKEKDKDYKEQKKKEKEKKEKEKKEKSKEKDKEKERKEKKDKSKLQQQFSLSSDKVLELGFPVFGVSIGLATDRSRCHDGVELPLIVRDCIDFLQEHALKSEQIYRIEPMKARLLHYRRLYNNRERQPESDELDIPTACGLLKLFFKELPEPILTTDLISKFEEVASHPQVTKQQEELQQLIAQLPKCNKTLLAWLLLHFDEVIQHEKSNKMNAQSLAMLLSPPLQMSHRLLVTLLCHGPTLFADIKLNKYIPPITSTSPKLPERPHEIQIELRKQESLLNQIHSEMHAGFVSKKREEQLWEVQRIITQLKRKLRSFEKRQEKSIEELESTSASGSNTSSNNMNNNIRSNDTTDSVKVLTAKTATNKSILDNDSVKIKLKSTTATKPAQPAVEPRLKLPPPPSTTNTIPKEAFEEQKSKSVSYPQELKQTSDNTSAASASNSRSSNENSNNNADDGLYVDKKFGLLMLPKTHPEYYNLLRLQLENKELHAWQTQLQTRIGSERAEILRLKQKHHQKVTQQEQAAAAAAAAACKSRTEEEPAGAAAVAATATETSNCSNYSDYERIVDHYVKMNTKLEQKKQLLAREIFEERKQCISMQVELALRQF